MAVITKDQYNRLMIYSKGADDYYSNRIAINDLKNY